MKETLGRARQLATRMRSVPYNINRTIWENTERSRDAEIFN